MAQQSKIRLLIADDHEVVRSGLKAMRQAVFDPPVRVTNRVMLLWAEVLQNADQEIRSHNIFYSMADLMGIQWPGASPVDSFASDRFVPDLQSPQIAGGTLVSPMGSSQP